VIFGKTKMVSVGIVGGTGYTGVELLRILVVHPLVEIKVITSRVDAGKQVAEVFHNLRGLIDLAFVEPEVESLSQCDVVFFATPNGIAMKMTPQLLEAGVKVIDLAADFRMKNVDLWEQWYEMPHACPELVEEAVYGLPELNREQIKSARLVANPGCYPTAVTLGFKPLLVEELIDIDYLIADVKSGVSGAGRKASVGLLMSEVGESFKAYAVPGHRHQPEIAQTLSQIAGCKIDLTFVPHLLPMIRGIHATMYAKCNKSEADLQALYESHYIKEPFVDVMPAGSHPDTRATKGANYCRLAVHQSAPGNSLVILSVIDNLVKGAAGQAVQNMNIMCNFNESEGLMQVALSP
jgi:N-acetyl-gamma-glutamyl-phosphate reductase